MTLGQKLQQLRKSRGMSQEDLAGQLSVTRQTISKWELDQSTPDLTLLAAISDLFGVSTDYLIKGQDSPKAPASQLSPAEMEALLGKLQRKRPSARQVFFVLFLSCLAGIVFPMVVFTIAEIFHLDDNDGNLMRACLLIFMISTVMSVPCGISAAILTWKERHPPQ